MDLTALKTCFRMTCLCVLAVALFLFAGCNQQKEAPRVAGGFIDLSDWDFDTDGPVRLFGEWEFVWDGVGRDFPAGEAVDSYPVPGLWRGQTTQGETLAPHGNAVYRLRLKMPDGRARKMAVLVAGGMSVCEIRINGTPMASGGTLGRSKAEELPHDHFVIAESPEAWRIMEIELHVSNYHNVQGGLNGDVLLGTAGQINGFYSTPRLLGACMAGALFCLSLLYISLYFMRRSARENLYFGLFCLFWCAAILFSPSSGFLMTQVVPSMSWKWYIACSMLPYGATVPLMLLFYHSLLPKKYGWIMERVYLALGALYAVYILATPPNAYDIVLFFYFLLTSIVLIYMFACFIIDVIRREVGVGILVVGYLALAVAELDDILFDLNVIDVASMRPFGIFVFILSYAFYLAFRFSRAFNQTEELTGELEGINARLVRLDKLKDEFLANTTHELKTPLAGMIGIAESLLAKGDSGLPNATRAHLDTIVHSGRRLSKLINDVLDFSRLKHRDVILHKEAVSPHAKVQQVLALAGALKRGDAVTLSNDIPFNFPPVLADPDRLEQVLFNLIGNSLKFTESGSVSVKAEVRDDTAVISVIDTGKGISSDDMQRIFLAYEQGGGNGSGGTGIGLSISRQLVEMHGGSLSVESTEGRGSTFSFTLPLASGDESASPEIPVIEDIPMVTDAGQPDVMEADRDRYQVLVVDDEPVNLQVVASILDLAGISFRTAGNGRQALQMIESGDEPDMVLLDVMMPDMSGYDVCRKLRRDHPASTLPVVLLTVKSRVADIVEGFAAGANDYLTKPFSRDELRARVVTQLKLKEAYATLAENAELRREIDMRRKTENHLRFMQARLDTIFDSLDDAILAVNQSCEIVFRNAPLAGFVSADHDLLGRPLTDILPDAPGGPSAALLDYCCRTTGEAGQSTVFENVDVLAGAEQTTVSIWVSRVEYEEETLSLLMLRLGGNGASTGLPLPAQLVRDLDANRQRVLALEEAMRSAESVEPEKRQQLVEDVKALDGLLGRINSRLQAGVEPVDKRTLAVRVMNLAMDCWVDATGTTKADMAEESGLWNVYMERDGYFRTQTLDKYLEMETLPKNPRWKKVFVTAEYVLANCEGDSPVRRELEQAVEDLKNC